MQRLEFEELVRSVRRVLTSNGQRNGDIGYEALAFAHWPLTNRITRVLRQHSSEQAVDFSPRSDAHLPQVFIQPPLDGVVLHAEPITRKRGRGEAAPVCIEDRSRITDRPPYQ